MIKRFFRRNRETSRDGQSWKVMNEERKTERKKETGAVENVQEEVGEALQNYLLTQYDLRYNLLTEETEFRPNDSSHSVFIPIGQREMNTLCMDARAAGIKCWDRDINRYLLSTRVHSYHPLRLYMEELPEWDGQDRVTELAQRISVLPLWVKSFHTWMLAVVAQWTGLEQVHANCVAPILVSNEQGHLKSTFCKGLLPVCLQRYYTEKFSLTSQGDAERKLAEMALINLDEFDRYSPLQMPQLKNLMQLATLNLRKPHQKSYRLLPRIASFIGTSNRMDLLSDPSGSRRYICIEVEHAIDLTDIEHTQIYAQLKTELLEGKRYWFNKEEESQIQQHNLSFYRQTLVEEVLRDCFCPALEEEPHELLSAAEIFRILQQHNPTAMRAVNPNHFSQILAAAGVIRKHTKWGNVYRVRKLTGSSEKE
ncbi:VapE domain-containing protein [Bacteroides sp.]